MPGSLLKMRVICRSLTWACSARGGSIGTLNWLCPPGRFRTCTTGRLPATARPSPGSAPRTCTASSALAALDALQAGVTTVVEWAHPIPYDAGAHCGRGRMRKADGVLLDVDTDTVVREAEPAAAHVRDTV